MKKTKLSQDWNLLGHPLLVDMLVGDAKKADISKKEDLSLKTNDCFVLCPSQESEAGKLGANQVDTWTIKNI